MFCYETEFQKREGMFASPHIKKKKKKAMLVFHNNSAKRTRNSLVRMKNLQLCSVHIVLMVQVHLGVHRHIINLGSLSM